MSTNTKFYHRMELAFWDWFIDDLSQSKIFRYLVALWYRITSNKRYAHAWLATFLVTGIGGICFGIVIAYLVTSLR